MSMRTGKTSGVYKGDRPVSFIFVPSAGSKWQVMSKVSAVWCKRFDGSTIDDFLEDLFSCRDRTHGQRACVIADFFSSKGRAVQMWDSIRYLEASCRLCKAVSEGAIGQNEGSSLFRLMFAQAGWILLEPGMTKATEGNPSFVQRSADGKKHLEPVGVGHSSHPGRDGTGWHRGNTSENSHTRSGENHKGSLCMPRGVVWAWVWNTKCRGCEVHKMHDNAHGPGGFPGGVVSARGCAAFACCTMVH